MTEGPADAARWRTETRKALVAARLRVPEATREAWSAAIEKHLPRALPEVAGRVIGFCWPFRGEPDVRGAVRRFIAQGARAALPVVVAPAAPLAFRQWDESTALVAGAFDIPVPGDTAEVLPDVLLLPANGFDAAGFRLGYGAGFFDRTLASMEPRPRVVGIAYEMARIPTTWPQSHDQQMDVVVTEAGIFDPVPGGCRGRAA